MSHPNSQGCFCAECRGDEPMPKPCNKCSFAHRSESSCAVESTAESECTCYASKGLQCVIHKPKTYVCFLHGLPHTESDCELFDQAKETLRQDKEKMGLLSKYKPRDNNNFKQFKRRDFLKKEHFPKSGELQATIIELRDAFEGSYSDMLLDIKCGKTEYTVGIKNDSVLLDQLVQALGQDEKKWRNKSVTFELAKGKYINLKRERASGKQSKPKSRKAAAKR